MSQAEVEEVVDPVVEEDAPEAEVAEDADSSVTEAAEGAGAEESDEVVVSIEGESPPPEEEDEFHGKPAPDWVKELRKRERELARENRELKAKASQPQQAETAAPLGAKPTLEGCGYDADRFETELTAWHTRKREQEAQAEQHARVEKDAQKAWDDRLSAYSKAKAGLKVGDFDDAEARANDRLSVVQQGVLLQGAKRPELLVYALGKNPKKLEELASIQDPVKFAFAAAELETKLNVTPRKAIPPPEKKVTGGAAITGSSAAQLAKLEAEAGRTGDRSKVIAFKRQHREKK